jgi:hypothetical protein
MDAARPFCGPLRYQLGTAGPPGYAASGGQDMQKVVAFVVPLVALVCGLVALRSARRAHGKTGDESGSWLDTAAPILLVAYGAITINNLALARVTFLGSTMLGYGPRYALVDTLATACLFLAALAWAQGAVRRARPGAGELDPSGSSSLKADLKVIVLQIVGLAVLLGAIGVFMEYLRNAHILPWSAP